MNWDQTIASKCRYGRTAGRLFENAEVIWEHSEADWQGFANVFAKLPDGRFCHYEWTYGSCSGCDEWESRGLSGNDVEKEMRRSAAYFDNADQVRSYLKLEGKYAHASVPTANSPTNGSIPGMMRCLGGWGSDFETMRAAVGVWLDQHEPVMEKVRKTKPRAAKKKTKKMSKK